MTLPTPLVISLILIIAFLSSSTFYFFNQNRSANRSTSVVGGESFNAKLPPASSELNDKIDSLTKPATARGRLSYPANVYEIAPRESLASVGAKLGLPWQLIKSANGLSNENLIQAGDLLAIPKLHPETDYYRLGFLIDEALASQLSRQTKDGQLTDRLDPLNVAKTDSPPYFYLDKESSNWRLVEADHREGTALVEATNGQNQLILIGLFQPKIKGKGGIWALLYVEQKS